MKPAMQTTYTLLKFCIEFHSGQSSRGYRLQCRLINRIKRHGFADNWKHYLPCNEEVYNILVRTYGDKI